MNLMRHGQKCQINDELNGVKCMKTLDEFITSSETAIRTFFPILEKRNHGSVISENENRGEEDDGLTNKEERRDNYMIYIYILLNLFGILFVIIRHGNEQLRRISPVHRRVMNARVRERLSVDYLQIGPRVMAPSLLGAAA